MPGAADASQGAVAEFLAVMRRLRAECPWKREQTHRSLARYLLEETYETLEAIDAGDSTGDWEHLREELGDLLLQVVFHAVIAEQRGEFDLDDVAADVTAKMVRRNPHVFRPERAETEEGGQVAERTSPDRRPDHTASSVSEVWEQIKAAEKQRSSVDDGLPAALPALLYADKLLGRLERAGRPVAVDPGSGDVGERLLALVVEARDAGTDPEQALRDAVRRRL